MKMIAVSLNLQESSYEKGVNIEYNVVFSVW